MIVVKGKVNKLTILLFLFFWEFYSFYFETIDVNVILISYYFLRDAYIIKEWLDFLPFFLIYNNDPFRA